MGRFLWFHLAPLLAGGTMCLCVLSSAFAYNNAINDITWTFGPDMPAMRKAGAAGIVNGTIVYASGGQDAQVFQTNSTYGYVPGASEWTILPNMPASLAYLDGQTVNGALYAVNGRVGGMAGSTVKSIYRLSHNGSNFVWDTVPQQMAQSRAFYTLARVGTKMYAVAGGRFTNNSPVGFWDRQTNDADVIDAANLTAGAQMIPNLPGVERVHPTTAGVGGKLYVFGGTNYGAPDDTYADDRLHDAYSFDPATNQWTTLPNLPFGHAGAYATVYKDRFIIMTGGEVEIDDNGPWPPRDPGYRNKMVVVYDTRLGTYDVLPSYLPEATGDLRVVIIDDKLYAMGGETGGEPFNSKRLRIGQIQFGPGEWDSSISATWNASASWSTTVPNGVGSLANFLGKISAPTTVTLTAPVTAGYVTFQNPVAYTLAGSGTLTLQVPSGDGFISLAQGSHSILAPMRMISPMKILGPGTLTAGAITNNATLTVQTGVVAGKIDGTGRIVVPVGRSLSAAGITQDVMDVTGTVTISAGRSAGKTSNIKALNLAAGARFNLNDNDLIINYSGTSPLNTVRSQIISGYANGAWNGVGINSSTAAAGGTVRMALGYSEASLLSLGTFSGQSVDATSILIRYTAAGDATLDGTVDSLDFGRFISSYGQSNVGWISGDFDYNLKVNSLDFNLLAGNFGAVIPSPVLGTVVPEPVGLMSLVMASLLLFRKRAARVVPSVVVAVAVTQATSYAQAIEKPAITAAELLDATAFPESQFGMKVESADLREGRGSAVTTGGVFEIDPSNDQLRFRQRVPIEREVATLQLPKGALASLQLTHKSSGATIFTCAGATIRINCDSLAMVQLKSDGTLTASLSFTPDFHNHFKGNYNFFDPQGGISFFENGCQATTDFRAAKDPVTVSWTWKAGDVFWAGVSPPKAFDWEASLRARVVFCGSSVDRFMYPSDGDLYFWSKESNILYLHNEMGWENWQLSLVPRDLAGFKRVMNTAHEFGMKTIVYASPHFFLKGSPQESEAHPDPHVGKGTFVGSNVREYLKQATRIVKEFGCDGLYFDEIYSSRESLATQYWLSRMSRELVGEAGLLFFHSTTDVLGAPHAGPVCPAINAYYNIIYKGEGEWDRWDPGYTRYVLSTYNVSNALGVQIVDERFAPTPEKLDFWMRFANCRFFLPAGYYNSGMARMYREQYWPRLNGRLPALLEPDLLKPTGVFEQFRKSVKESTDRSS